MFDVVVEDYFNAEFPGRLAISVVFSRGALRLFRSLPRRHRWALDTTGGNSGSPTLNAKGEINGLLFDGWSSLDLAAKLEQLATTPALVERLAVANTAAVAETPGKLAKADDGMQMGDMWYSFGLASAGAIDLRPVVLYNPSMLSVVFIVPETTGGHQPSGSTRCHWRR